jgi:hypothetical protein
MRSGFAGFFEPLLRLGIEHGESLEKERHAGNRDIPFL